MAWENLPSTNTPLNATNLDKITDSGSTANGYYIKFQDGTLIQYGLIDKTEFLASSTMSNNIQGINIYRSNVYNLTFPVSFKDTNYTVAIQPQLGFTSGASRLTTTRYTKLTKATCEIQMIGIEDFISSGNGYINLNGVEWAAFGRWK